MDIVVTDLTMAYRRTRAVDGLSFTARAGRVTGFLGPNGAGKTTTLRAVIGLAEPDSGSALIGDLPLRTADHPPGSVGALLDTRIGHPGRTAEMHLRAMGAALGCDRARVTEVLHEVGLHDARQRRIRALSLGMKQRLGLAVALLGNPGVLVLDEPFNGLDPAGVRWLRDLFRHLAADGATVLLSSHLLAEIALVADDVVMIAGGRLLATGALDDFGDLETAFLELTTIGEPS